MPTGLRSRVPAKITSSIRVPAQALGRLLAEHPADGVADVRLAAAVGALHSGDPFAGEAQFGAVAKGFESLDFHAFEFQQGNVLFGGVVTVNRDSGKSKVLGTQYFVVLFE